MKRTELKRTPMKRTAMRQRPTREPAELTAARKVVEERSQGRCELTHEGCDGTASGGIHHRKLRRHNDHRPVTLLAVCRTAHDWIHANPELANHLGWAVPSYMDPEKVPVLSAGELAEKLRAKLAAPRPELTFYTESRWHIEQQETARVLRLLENQQDTA